MSQFRRRLSRLAASTLMPCIFGERHASGIVAFFLFFLACLHGALYALLIPPWQAPDETAHVWTSIVLARTGDYYRAENDVLIQQIGREISASLRTFHAFDYLGYTAPSPWPEYYGELPFFQSSVTLLRFSLAYHVYGAVIWPIASADVVALMYVMRLISILMGGWVVVIAYYMGRLVAPASPHLALGVACTLIFLPQHAHIMASVNDGNLAELLATAAIFCALKAVHDTQVWYWLALTIGCVLLAQWVKATAAFLVLALPVVTLLALFRLAPQMNRRLMSTLVISVMGLAVLGIVVWYSPFSVYLQPLLGTSTGLLRLSLLGCAQSQNIIYELWVMFRTFWMDMGWLRVKFDNPNWYSVVLTVIVIGALGLPLGGWKILAQHNRLFIWLLGVVTLLCLLVPVALYCIYPYSPTLTQGRYWFPGLAPMATLVVAGWLGVTRGSSITVPLLVLALVALDALALFQTAIPYYYRL